MLTDLLYRLRALFRRRTVETELNDELQFHLDHQIEKFRRAGLSETEATRQARLSVGGIEQMKEDCREARGIQVVEALIQDFVYAFRVLRKSPGFTAAVTISLALGIGANTAIFSLIDAVMWRMLPVSRPQELMLLTHGQGASFEDGFTYPQFRLMREQNHVMASLAAWSSTPLNISVDGSIEPTTPGQLVSGNYFSTLGVQAAAGRAISVEDDRRASQQVAMISHGYWTRRFALSPSVIGRTITLSGAPFTVVGVTPKDFYGVEVGYSPDVFVPMIAQPAVVPSSENLIDQPGQYLTWVRIVGRLQQGVQRPEAAARLEVLFQQEIPKGGKFSPLENEKLALAPAAAGLSDLRREFSQPLFILMALVGIVLLIACANTANLLLARATSRQAEFSLRVALGARRQRLINQLLVESLVLSSLGGLLGIVLASWATRLLIAFMSSGRSPIVLDLQLNLRVLAFTATVSVATGILFGLIPALRATRISLGTSIKSRSGHSGLRSGKFLAIAQVALSLVLLIGAGLFVRSLQNVNSHDAGFARDTVLIVRVEPKGSNQRNSPGTTARLDRTYRELMQRVGSIPGVRSASMAQFTPTAPRGANARFTMPTGEEKPAFLPMVYPDYFVTMGIGMVAGRDFLATDLNENAPLVAIVNETLARQAFPGTTAVGKQLAIFGEKREIIGVVRDSAYLNPRGENHPTIYQLFLQTRTGRGQMALYARVTGDAGGVLPYIRDAVQDVDKQLPTFEVHTLSQEMDAVLIRERLLAMLSGLFSVLALLLASVGLYGLFAFAVVQRTNEIGIRMALGARRSNVVWTILREVMILVAAGIAIGVPAALIAAKLASSQIAGLLYKLNPSDPLTISVAVILLALAALIAGLLPAARASRVDPIIALRSE